MSNGNFESQNVDSQEIDFTINFGPRLLASPSELSLSPSASALDDLSQGIRYVPPVAPGKYQPVPEPHGVVLVLAAVAILICGLAWQQRKFFVRRVDKMT